MKNSQDFLHFSSRGDTNALPRTDLACESVNVPLAGDGAAYREYSVSGIAVSELFITGKEGEAQHQKKAGRYVTVHSSPIAALDDGEAEALTDAIASLLVSFTEGATKRRVSAKTKVLVAGLGNRFLSADSIGPRTADKIAVTAHMQNSPHRELFDLIGCSSISAVHPGVMGQTGIEAAAMIKGAADYARPDVIIAVDALAARSARRLCATVQLSDTGIEPGSGIGRRRCAVDRETMGYPVIALGVPTVIDCATLIFDALERYGKGLDRKRLSRIFKEEEDLFVSPKDCDIVSEKISSLLAAAINRAFLCEGL